MSDTRTSGGEHPLFEDVVAASGLAGMIGPSAIQRACARVGIANARSMTRSDLHRALPSIEQALKIYLPDDKVAERMRAITALVR